MTSNRNDLSSINQLANHAKISASTIINYIKKGVFIPPDQEHGNMKFYKLSDLNILAKALKQIKEVVKDEQGQKISEKLKGNTNNRYNKITK